MKKSAMKASTLPTFWCISLSSAMCSIAVHDVMDATLFSKQDQSAGFFVKTTKISCLRNNVCADLGKHCGAMPQQQRIPFVTPPVPKG